MHYIDGSCGASGDIDSGSLLRDNKGDWIPDFSSNNGKGNTLFAEHFGVYYGWMLVIKNAIQQVICKIDYLEVFTLFNIQITRICMHTLLCW
ncbi:RnaseH protein, putative [Medicago truncatula]|uniref:RnaseH protein, putative n=1 Tax=Medicago truncatula TaxID=3880 RepID=A0A072UHQ6_MEDTR|nr:RnaseH protein, putative [Medicago truncatula]